VEPDPLARLALLEEHLAIDAGGLEVRAEALGVVVVLADPLAVLADEKRRGAREPGAGERLAVRHPRAKGAHGARVERPGARIVRLVLVQGKGTALKVDVGQHEGGGFAETRPLAVEEAIQHAPAQRYRDGTAERRVFVWVDPPLRLLRAHLGQVALGQRVDLHELQREHREPKDPVHELRVMAARRRGSHRLARERAHDPVGVVDAEVGYEDVPEDRVDVRVEPFGVAPRRLLRLHVVREGFGELARRPPLADGLEGGALGLRGLLTHLASAELSCRLQHRSERFPIAGAGALQVAFGQVGGDVCGAQLPGKLGQDFEAGDGRGLVGARWKRHAAAALRGHHEARVPASMALVDVSGSCSGHGLGSNERRGETRPPRLAVLLAIVRGSTARRQRRRVGVAGGGVVGVGHADLAADISAQAHVVEAGGVGRLARRDQLRHTFGEIGALRLCGAGHRREHDRPVPIGHGARSRVLMPANLNASSSLRRAPSMMRRAAARPSSR
jgi:hypothetical protein